MDLTRRLFEEEERQLLSLIDHFYQTLAFLRFEGKVSFGKNIKQAKNDVARLGKRLSRHQRLQREVIFPFLAAHIPRHETIIRFLVTDHAEILKTRKKIQSLIDILSKRRKTDGGKYQEMQDTGIYWVCLLKQHLLMERTSIHKSISNELSVKEKKEMSREVQKWLQKNGGCCGF